MSAGSARRALGEAVLWASLVKLSHSVFALPFALSMAAVVSAEHSITPAQLTLILLAVVSARTAAMGFNRLVDRHFDAGNPRTSGRELPSGKLSASSVRLLVVTSSLIFVLCAAGLGAHAAILSPLVLAILFFYSLTKRFTRYSHAVLGLALSLAPGGVWYALTARVEMLPVWMMIGVLAWVAGFDIIYSCQDAEFDRKNGLFSIPARIGVARALTLARSLHVAALCFLGLFGLAAGLGVPFYLGLSAFAAFLFTQHRLVSAQDLSRVDAAFFTMNGLASFVFLAGVCLDRWIR